MGRVDKIYQENLSLVMSQPWEEVKRPVYNDGSGVKVKRVLQVCNQYDLRREFPLGTIRKVPYKLAIKEILAIWQKRSNSINDLGKIWEQWSFNDTSAKLVRVKPVILENTNNNLKDVKIANIIDENLELHDNSNGPKYYCINKDYNNRRVQIQFEDTGYTTWVAMSAYHSGKIKSPFERTVHGIGYLGNFEIPEILDFFGNHLEKWKNHWYHLFNRCGNYKGYENIFVHESFHCLCDFLLWVKKEIHERGDLSLLENGCLDKDYYHSNCYSAYSCTILTHKENNCLKHDKFYIYKNKNVMYSYNDVARFMKDKGYELFLWNDSVLSKKSREKVDSFLSENIKNGDIKVIDNKDNGYGYPRFQKRTELFIRKCYGFQMDKLTYGFDSQTDYVLHEIKHNPTSRRIVTSMYSPNDNDEKSLLECAFSTMWSVKNGELYMTLIQRSSDYCVSGLWNVCQYAALMTMFAHDAGLKPAVFTHFIQDMHVYDRHEEQANELLGRSLFGPIPQVTISSRMDGKGFYDFTEDDFEVWQYEPKEQIKFEVAK